MAALADLPSREVLLAQIAGAIAAPLQQFAGLLQALPRNLAYGLSALVDQRGGVPEEAQAPSEPVAEAPTAEAPDQPVAQAPGEPVAESPVEPAPEPEPRSETDAGTDA